MEFEPFGVGATTSAGILFQGESKGWERDSRLGKQLEILMGFLAPHSLFSLFSGATGVSPRPGGKKCSWARGKWDICPGAVDAMPLHIYCIIHIFVPIFSAGPLEICPVAFSMATGSLCSHLGSSLSHLLFFSFSSLTPSLLSLEASTQECRQWSQGAFQPWGPKDLLFRVWAEMQAQNRTPTSPLCLGSSPWLGQRPLRTGPASH